MKKVIYHTVLFGSPGTFMSEQTSKRISSWDVVEALRMSANITERYGAKPFGFRFVTYETLEDVPDDFQVQPKEIARSGMHYFNGRLRTKEEILAGTDPAENILRSNVRCNDMKAIVESIDPNNYKWTMPFEEGDVLVDANTGEVIAEAEIKT